MGILTTRRDKKVGTTVYIDSEQRDALATMSSKTRIPQASIIRHGIDLALVWYEEREEALEKGLAIDD